MFYTYVVVDMNQLRNNLVGHPSELAVTLTRNLVKVMATVSPGAKKGSTAPYSYAEFVLLERGNQQPRTLANAFLEAVRTDGAQLTSASVSRLLEHRQQLDAMYGAGGDRSGIATIHAVPEGFETMSLSEAVESIIDA